MWKLWKSHGGRFAWLYKILQDFCPGRKFICGKAIGASKPCWISISGVLTGFGFIFWAIMRKPKDKQN
jgi:hypothetical protein